MPKPNEIVTVVHNETKEESTGRILEYTKNRIVIIKNNKFVTFDAKKVHFKNEGGII